MRGVSIYVGILFTCCDAHLRSNFDPLGRSNYSLADGTGVAMDSNHKPSTVNKGNVPVPTNVTLVTQDTYGRVAEYYGTLVSCAGKVFLLTRFSPKHVNVATESIWRTRVRELRDFSENIYDLPSVIIPYNHQAHNVAGICVNNKVILVGGQWIPQYPAPWNDGIWISETDPTSLNAFAQISPPQLMLRGDRNGCIDEREENGKMCPFDGRFSLIHFQDRFILFARSNIPSRAVQMTESSDLKNWSSFRLINIRDIVTKKSQIYFLTATVMKKDELIVGHFPGILIFPGQEERSSGIHFTWSKDGFNWEAPKNVYEADRKYSEIPNANNRNGMYSLHPVGIFKNRLLTQEPKTLSRAISFSQEFRDLADMSKPLNLTYVGRAHHELLLADDVSYDMGVWNE